MINKSLIITQDPGTKLVDITLYKEHRILKSIRLMNEEFEDLKEQLKKW